MSTANAITILGMHRSGTSALAGVLKQAGVYFGNVQNRGFSSNKKGLKDALSVLHMQEDLLVKNGGGWHTPPEKIEWLPLHKAVRDLFIESREPFTLWGLKDPRTLLTLEGWLEALPELRCVGIFRHPIEVASSIKARNGFPLERGFEIWQAYNTRLLDHQIQHNFPIIEFVQDQAALNNALKRIVHWVDPELSADTDFMDVSLRNQQVQANEPVEIPAAVLETYERLQERSH
jgi:hypothetical protein